MPQLAPRIERYLAIVKNEYEIRRTGAGSAREVDVANNRLNIADHGPIVTSATMSAKYCRECGGRLDRKWLESELQLRAICCNCYSITYENPRVLVCCYLYWQDKLIFCRRANAPARGRWALPGGFVERGETLEAAVIREVHEETGIRLNPRNIALYRVMSIPHMNEVYVEFRSELVRPPQTIPGPEMLEVEGFTQAEIPRRELAFAEMIPDYPDEFYRCVRANKFPIRSTVVRPADPS
jgi:ADP-ribose pyrophosphatase YjhB (NUDIX family)